MQLIVIIAVADIVVVVVVVILVIFSLSHLTFVALICRFVCECRQTVYRFWLRPVLLEIIIFYYS